MNSDAPDDTEKKSSKSWATRYMSRRKSLSGTTIARVQAIKSALKNLESQDEESDEGSDEDISPNAGDHDCHVIGLYAIQVPETENAAEAYGEYCALVQKIQANPKVALMSPCIVCGGEH